mmetsp:Transcript_492/g.1021  ORF Transcript_492/g.1021 Transcript_492/m.1021 type:complete len:209 (-) Transcript_492:142-768(-)
MKTAGLLGSCVAFLFSASSVNRGSSSGAETSAAASTMRSACLEKAFSKTFRASEFFSGNTPTTRKPFLSRNASKSFSFFSSTTAVFSARSSFTMPLLLVGNSEGVGTPRLASTPYRKIFMTGNLAIPILATKSLLSAASTVPKYTPSFFSFLAAAANWGRSFLLALSKLCTNFTMARRWSARRSSNSNSSRVSTRDSSMSSAAGSSSS